jgi:hypothetical protein
METRLCLRLWWGLVVFPFGGSVDLGCRFSGGAFRMNLTSIAVKVFLRFI